MQSHSGNGACGLEEIAEHGSIEPAGSGSDSVGIPLTRVHVWIGRSIILLLSLLAFALYRSLSIDDMFITFRYAENLAMGHGLVYNLGERVQGFTSPLWCLILAGARLPGLDLHPTAVALSLVFAAATVLVLFEWFHRHRLGAAAYLVPFVLLGNQQLLATVGMESWMFLFFSVLGVLCSFNRGRKREIMGGIAFGVAILARPDCALGLLLATGRLLLVRRWKGAAIMAVTALAVTTPWWLFAWLYYGTPLTNTLSAKMVQGHAMGMRLLSPRFIEAVVGPFASFPLLPLIPFVLIGFWRLIRNPRPASDPIAFLVVWAVAFDLAYYAVLRVKPYPWYNSLPTVAFCLTALLAFEWLAEYFLERWRAFRASQPRFNLKTSFIIGLLAILLLGGAGSQAGFVARKIQRRFTNPVGDPRYLPYVSAAVWVRENTPENSAILLREVGAVGYVSGRTIVDMERLVSRHPPDTWSQTEVYISFENDDRRPDWIKTTHQLAATFPSNGFPTLEVWVRSVR